MTVTAEIEYNALLLGGLPALYGLIDHRPYGVGRLRGGDDPLRLGEGDRWCILGRRGYRRRPEQNPAVLPPSGGKPLNALLLVVVGLGYGGIGFMASRGEKLSFL